MSGDLDLEQRYRRVLRLLPGYYRDRWEEDMVAAFLDSWMTGDADEDSVIMEFDRPSRREMASVAGLAARLYLGGASAPHRYFAWGQAVRGTVLAVLLVHTMLAFEDIVFLAWIRHRIGWLPAPPPMIAPGGLWAIAVAWYAIDWIVLFIALVLGHYRAARITAVLVIVTYLVPMLHAQFTGHLLSPFWSWANWILFNLVPVLAIAAFHRDAPPVARRPWLLALLASLVLAIAPMLATHMTGQLPSWLPDFPGQCCLLIALACLAHAPKARSSRAGTGEWSLTLVLTAAFAGVYRITTLGDYLHDPHLIKASMVELLILVAAAALVTQDAARTQTALPAPPPHPRLG